MREQILSKLRSLAPPGVSITNELPYDEGGVPMYIKNPKRFYVDRPQIDSVPIIKTFNGVNINNTTTSVTVYVTLDAKTPMAQLDDIISGLRSIEDTIELEGAHTKENVVSTDYDGDLLTVTIEYRLTRIN